MGSLRSLICPLLPPRDPDPSLPLGLCPDVPLCSCCWICGWGKCRVLPSPFPLSLLCLSLSPPRPYFLFRPVPWPLGIGPVAQEPGFGHYVGRPPAFGELSGPRWPGTALQASPSPLMGKVLPPLLLSRPALPLFPPPLHFFLSWGGGALQVLGVSPHILVQSAHEGRARLLGGCPPLPFGMVSLPILSSPSLHAMSWGRTLLGGSPQGIGWILRSPPSMHAVR